MITNPTVLILGAGASQPYGFPTGRELLLEICDILLGRTPTQSAQQFVRDMIACVDDAGHLERFRTQLYKSGKSSVDAFLEHRSEFVAIGKLAIARALIPRECPDSLIETSRDSKSWYELLFNSLNSKFEDFGNNNLAILTYNYDRSLEEYLFTSLKNAYDRTDEETASTLQQIPIIHLHGQLGYHPSQGNDIPNTKSYSPTIENLRRHAEGIKIINEADPQEQDFARAHKLLERARFVCFLGFGYDPVNLQRLKLPPTSECRYFGSTYGLGEGQRSTAINRLPGQRPNLRKLGGTEHDCFDYLRAVSILD